MMFLENNEALIARMRRENTHDEEQRLVIIGNGVDGNPYADDNRIWVRDIGSKGANGYSVGAVAYRVLAGTGYKPEIDRHVWLEWKNGPGEWQVEMSDPDFMQVTGRSMHLENWNDPHNQFRTTEGLLPLLSKPLPGGKANVQGWQFVTEDGQYGDYKGTSDDSTAISQHQNVVSLAPATAAHHAYVLLVFNITKFFAGVDDPIEMFVSTSKSWFTPLNATDIQECVNQKDESSRTIKVYRVYTGQTTLVGHADDRDLRGWLNVPGSGSGAPDDATYIIQTADADLPNAQVLGALGTGLLKNTTTTGLLSIATASDIPNLPASKITSGLLSQARGALGTDLSITGGGGGGFAHQPSLGAAFTIRKIVYADLPPTLATYATSGIVGPSDIDALYNVYLNASGEWCAIDTNAVPAEVGRVRGVNANYAEPGDSPIILIHGVQSGYSGLTPGLPLYATNTPGGYSQTPPALTVGGGQIVLCQMGIALTATEVWIDPKPVEFIIRDNLADTDTLTLEHYDDARRERVPAAYIATTLSAAIETYATSNQDNSAQLKGISGAGALVTVDTVGTTLARLGNNGSAQFEEAQAVTLTAGRLTGITFALGANTGSPTGDLTIELRASTGALPGGIPSTVLWSTTHTPTASANNTVTVTNGPIVDAGLYWLNIRATTQASNVGYNLQYNNANPYAGGVLKADSSASPGTWATFGTTQDLRCTVTTSAVTANDAIAQGVSHSSTTTVPYVDLYLKRTGTLSGNLTLRIDPDTAGMPSGTPITNGTSSTVAASSVTTGYTLIRFTFPTPPSITASTQYHIVLTTSDSASNANYIEWGTDTSSPGYANGAVALLQSAAWAAASPAADACFTLYGISTTYDQPIGSVGFGSDVLDAHYGDTVYADQDTMTTFTNVYGATLDVACIVRMD